MKFFGVPVGVRMKDMPMRKKRILVVDLDFRLSASTAGADGLILTLRRADILCP